MMWPDPRRRVDNELRANLLEIEAVREKRLPSSDPPRPIPAPAAASLALSSGIKFNRSVTPPTARRSVAASLSDLMPTELWPVAVFAGALFLWMLVVCFIMALYHRYKNEDGKRRSSFSDFDEVFDDLQLPHFGDELQSFFHYSFIYDMEKRTLRIEISHARNLSPYNEESVVNCYVTAVLVDPLLVKESNEAGRVLMKPPASCAQFTRACEKVYTQTVNDNRNPKFNASISLQVPSDVVMSKWLMFELYDHDPLGQDRKLGRVIVRLTELEPASFMGNVLELDSPVEVCADDEPSGDVCVILRYLHGDLKSDFQITVLEARSLKVSQSAIDRKSELQVKLSFYVRNKKFQTHTSSNHPLLSRNAYFNESFRATFNNEDIWSKAVIKLSVKCKTPPLRRLKNLGKVLFGVNVDNLSGRLHWKNVLRNPYRSVARWHQLVK